MKDHHTFIEEDQDKARGIATRSVARIKCRLATAIGEHDYLVLGVAIRPW